jgi:large subunit ribosomal protein L18
MNEKLQGRQRRAKKTRGNIVRLQERDADLIRMSVHRSSNHIYAQLLQYDALSRVSKVVATASTLDKTIRGKVKHTGNIEAATMVGALIAERAKALNINKIAFDRSGFRYHGRVKALADAAREAGLQDF